MKVLFTLLFFIMQDSDYQIRPVSDLKKQLKKEGKKITDFEYQMEQRYALVYYLDSGKVMMMPSTLTDGQNGIIFKSKEVFDKYVVLGKFPIENDNKAIEESFQSELLLIHETLPSIISFLNKLYSSDSVTLKIPDLLAIAQERMSSMKISDKEYFYATLLLGEYLRTTQANGRWILLKQVATFNPYYTPGIMFEDGSIIELLSKSPLFFNSARYTLDNFMKYPSIQNPPLKFGSKRFTNYVGHKLL